MGFRNWLGLQQREALPASTPAGILPPSRAEAPISLRESVAVPAAYRAIQVLTTSAKQLSVDAERGGVVVDNPPPVVRKPALDVSRSEWIADSVMSLAVSGNLYLKPAIVDGQVVDLPVLNPHHVHATQDERGRITYHYRGKRYGADELIHRTLMRLPGALEGLGPIQAARSGLGFARDVSEHVAGWFRDTGQPRGILSTDQTLSDAQARSTLNGWNNLDAEGQPMSRSANPSGVKVLGRGLHYEPILLNPRDALWLEAQQFTTLEIARLFGTPASLMLVAPEGDAQSYQNVAQEWLAFTRFTLMAYLRPIEDALTELTPRGTTVRFNLESLLRADTMTRYQGHALALANQWMDADEVRAIEHLAPRERTTNA